MKRTLTSILGGTAAAALAAGVLTATTSAPAAAAPDPVAPFAFGLSEGNQVVVFRVDNPSDQRRIMPINGIAEGEELVGIDVRPADGKLYGVATDNVLYRITPKGGVATPVNTLTVPLDGTSFDLDFNPAVDRLRIVSDTGQNLRHDPNEGGTGTISDTPLNTPPTAGPTTGIVAAAYTNNDASTDTGTILYDLSATADNLVTQTPANNGTLTAIGKTGRDMLPDTGFDIVSTNDAVRTVGNQGYVVTNNRLFTIDLSTGLLTRVGKQFSSDIDGSVIDIAVKQGPTAP